MDMIEHLKRLFRYDAWANVEVLASLQAADPVPARSWKLLAHILSAERLWLERLSDGKQSLPVWPEFTLAQCKVHADELPGLWSDYLSRLTEAGLGETASYKNSKGESWSSTREDILLHVTMHSAYHRGQIAADMRAAGFTPASTDFIHAARQGLLK
jgi:uncharacterized damage-inducible protein DinB